MCAHMVSILCAWIDVHCFWSPSAFQANGMQCFTASLIIFALIAHFGTPASLTYIQQP